MDIAPEEEAVEEVAPEAVSEEAAIGKPHKARSEGLAKKAPMKVPDSWPRWNKRCGATRSNQRGQCTQWCVPGMPTCKYHGSGGMRNRELGQLRYLCWIVCGGPSDIPVELAARLTLAVYAERVLNNGAGSVDQQMKAALWLTSLIPES